MATSQFYSVCLAHESIRACRALLLVSPCPFPRSFLRTRAMSVSELSFQGSPGYGLHCRGGPSSFACRALSSMGSSSRSRKPVPTSQTPREEIRRLDEEIRRLEKERRSVGKPNKGMPDAQGKSLYGGKKGNAGYGSDAVSKAKPSPVGRSAKFTASAGGSRSANARALARYEQEDAEEEEDDDDELEDDENDEDDDVLGEDHEELGEDFSSDAEMYMETSDEEQPVKDEISSFASSDSKKPSTDPTETLDSSQVGIEDPISEASVADNPSGEGGHSIKHPWKEWNDFYNVLAQKDYFKDVPPNKAVMEGEGYLQFQSSTHMKRAILDFSRERDDIIRFLTKKHIKAVVTVGCPSTDRKVVNACKRLRVLCEVPEDEVCQQCKLKTFCTRAFASPSPDLMAETADVARVLYSFALNASPIAESQVSYPQSVVKSVCHLVGEIVQLSAYPKDPGLPALKSRLPVKQPVFEKRDVDSNHRTGDWTCPDCNFKNFAKNRECRECGTFRESSKPLEPGDWECPKCTFVNFRRNRECRECSTRRPMDAGGSESLMPGEWKCPECEFVNFRRNTECFKCSTSRPKGVKLYDDEALEPGDWLCPECNFRNFKRNKNCKECGSVSPDQGKKDDRWGVRKSSGGWGSSRSLPPVSAENGASGGRAKYQEWKPDLSRKMSDDSDGDLEENADIVFGLGGEEDDEGLTRSSGASEKKSKTKGGVSQRKDIDDELPSDFDLSDLDDFSKKSSKKSEGQSKMDVVDDEDDDEDDDNDMEDELSEEEGSMPKAAAKQGRGFSGRWDDSASDEDEDDLPISRAAVKHKPVKGRGLSKSWDDSDDEEDGFSDDDDDDFGGRKSRGASARGGGGSNFGSRGGQRGGRFGSTRGRGRGESYGRGGYGRPSSNFSGSDEDQDFRRIGRGGGGTRGRGRGESYGRGSYGRPSSNFSGSDEDQDFRRSGRGGGGRGGPTRGNGRGGYGRHTSNFSGSDSDQDFRSGRGGGGRGGFTRGNGRGRGGGSSFRGGGGGFRGRGGRGRGGRGRS